MSSTTTVSTELSPSFGDPFQASITIPTKRPSTTEKNKIPITVFISKTGPDTPFGCYIYSIIHPKTSEVFQTILNNSNEGLLDITKKLSNVLCKKFQSPTYVNVNGYFDLYDYLGVIKAITEFIEEKYTELESEKA
ncbi:hypothetical protein BN7_6235 [Wickerhamomyces ciferrii]|uniref:Uncharacterized protein n=1 Tax=Wickerhamomyces ciferrii (strain ATCC 14091 / BCRC 22168 / CBS 111 / JCM 3599 / NBRC 0793 / NRRL Y-1031 F-60-10) TaxID=1206466 RepID=K0KMZ0_WICCF|nr:uncharacterized protein BN7_6235 [Wickerhamomyces ciferrii]CCH46640.1 hypothetical protein BN7_6235 [Wickerhamomyces ciferrii]